MIEQLLELGGLTGCMELREELPIFLNKHVVMPTTVINKALPYIQILPSTESYPIVLEGATKSEVKTESPGSFGFSANEVKYSLEIAKVGSSGLITLKLFGVKEKGTLTSCSTEGSAAGEVVLKGETRLVFTSLLPLTVGVLVTFPELVVKCGIRFETKAPLILGVKAGLKETTTSLALLAKCKETGRQEPSAYYNDKEELVFNQLLVWRRNESLLENACFSTGGETLVSGVKKFIIFG